MAEFYCMKILPLFLPLLVGRLYLILTRFTFCKVESVSGERDEFIAIIKFEFRRHYSRPKNRSTGNLPLLGRAEPCQKFRLLYFRERDNQCKSDRNSSPELEKNYFGSQRTRDNKYKNLSVSCLWFISVLITSNTILVYLW